MNRSAVTAQAGFVTPAFQKKDTTNLNWSVPIVDGIGLGRIVVPEIREKNYTHSTKKTTIFE